MSAYYYQFYFLSTWLGGIYSFNFNLAYFVLPRERQNLCCFFFFFGFACYLEWVVQFIPDYNFLQLKDVHTYIGLGLSTFLSPL